MTLIETPYGRKTPELLCKAMDVHVMIPDLVEAMQDAVSAIESEWNETPTSQELLRLITRLKELE